MVFSVREFGLNDVVTRALGLVGIVVAVVLGIPFLLYLMQEKLIFHPVRLSDTAHQALREQYGAEELRLVRDDVELHGWLMKNVPDGAKTNRLPLIVYFGGNAEEVSWLLDDAKALRGYAVALLNYRGYGRSEGSPSEAALFADALAWLDQLSARPDIDETQLYAFGRSLGSGVAVYVAENRPVQGVVLVSPYDSIRSIAKARYPFVPVDWLLNHPFDSLARAPSIQQPMLSLVAGEDRTIEPERSDRLIARWAGPASVVKFPNADHISIASQPEYWPSIREFLAATARK